MSSSRSFDLLAPQIQKWIWKQHWPSLLEIQENTIPLILRGDCDVIVTAPTGGGKTEAVFFPIISRLLLSRPSTGYYALYVSPLKALINDQARRFTSLCESIGIAVTPWHGDIPPEKKIRSFESPSGILIITPESLESLLMHHGGELSSAFCGLQYVVIDEIHYFVGKERGKQVQSLLSRIENCIGRRIPRIGMSATLSDYNDIQKYIRPGGELACEIPYSGDDTHEVRCVIKEFLASGDYDIRKDIESDLFKLLRGTSNLVFVQKRAEAESLTYGLSKMCENKHVPNEFYVHHGSISKDNRHYLETLLHEGKTPTTVICTSTLELGIDIGTVKSVAQLGACPSVSSLRQRIGRSGRRNEPSILRIYNVDRSDKTDALSLLSFHLVQSIAIIELIREKKYELYNVDKYHFSTLVQQILSILSQYGSFYPKEAWALLCKNGSFYNVSCSMFLDLLRSLGEHRILSQMQNGLIVIGEDGEHYIDNIDFYTAFTALPEIQVIEESTLSVIGTVDKIIPQGSSILLAGKSWLVKCVNRMRATMYVEESEENGRAPFEGTLVDIDKIIVEKMHDIYLSSEVYPYLDKNAKERLQIARNTFCQLGLNDNDYIEFDSLGADGITLHHKLFFTWAGTRINRTIALAVQTHTHDRLSYDAYYVEGIQKDQIEALSFLREIDAVELASRVPRSYKENQKHDWLVPDYLLDYEYSVSSLDVPGLLKYLSVRQNLG